MGVSQAGVAGKKKRWIFSERGREKERSIKESGDCLSKHRVSTIGPVLRWEPVI